MPDMGRAGVTRMARVEYAAAIDRAMTPSLLWITLKSIDSRAAYIQTRSRRPHASSLGKLGMTKLSMRDKPTPSP
jgi:hypothetical protein